MELRSAIVVTTEDVYFLDALEQFCYETEHQPVIEFMNFSNGKLEAIPVCGEILSIIVTE